MNGSAITVGDPRLFRLTQILVVNAIGIVVGLPCGVALGVGIGALVGGIIIASVALMAVGAVALVAFGASLFFLPLLWANPYICHLIRKGVVPAAEDASSTFPVQLALHPRLHTGVRGWIEDADDIGYLTVSPAGIGFKGDHVTLRLPCQSIVDVRTRSIGFRGLWFCGRRIELASALLGDREYVEFGDRAATTALGCVRNTKSILQAIRSVMEQGGPANPVDGSQVRELG